MKIKLHILEGKMYGNENISKQNVKYIVLVRSQKHHLIKIKDYFFYYLIDFRSESWMKNFIYILY